MKIFGYCEARLKVTIVVGVGERCVLRETVEFLSQHREGNKDIYTVMRLPG